MSVVPVGRATRHAPRPYRRLIRPIPGRGSCRPARPTNPWQDPSPWLIVQPEGTVAIDGRDFGELDTTSRIAHTVGFFGPPPAVIAEENDRRMRQERHGHQRTPADEREVQTRVTLAKTPKRGVE